MSYSVYWADRKGQKTSAELSPAARDRLMGAIAALARNPRPHGCKKLSGKLRNTWRLRVGDYRLLYDIDDKARRVVLLDLGHRKQIYR